MERAVGGVVQGLLGGGGRRLGQWGRVGGGTCLGGRGGGGRVMPPEGGVGDSLQQDMQVVLCGVWGLWGPCGERSGSQLSPDVTGRVGRTGGVGWPRVSLIRWQPSRRGRGV